MRPVGAIQDPVSNKNKNKANRESGLMAYLSDRPLPIICKVLGLIPSPAGKKENTVSEHKFAVNMTQAQPNTAQVKHPSTHRAGAAEAHKVQSSWRDPRELSSGHVLTEQALGQEQPTYTEKDSQKSTQ